MPTESAPAAVAGDETRAPVPPVPTPRVWVVVVTYNSADVVAECLGSLRTAFHDRLEVVVVDNASSDGTLDVAVAALPEVHTLGTGGNVGYSAAINRAVEAFVPDDSPVLVLNPDARLTPGSVDVLLRAARPGVGIVASRLVQLDGTTAPSVRRFPSVGRVWTEAMLGGKRAARLGRGEVVAVSSEYERAHEVDWTVGAAWLISPECRRAVGPWDESFLLYSEETDYALRAQAAGWRFWYEPAATVVHIGGEAMTSSTLYALLTLNRARAYRMHHTRGSSVFMLGLLLGETLRAASPRGHVHRAALSALFSRRAHLPGAPFPSRM